MLNTSDDIIEYAISDVAYVTGLLNGLTNKIKFSKEEHVPKRMWLVTEKDGGTMVIVSDQEPIRVGNTWKAESPSKKAYLDSQFLSEIFGIFWKEATEELKKIGLPKWEDDPLEIELSKIKFNYY